MTESLFNETTVNDVGYIPTKMDDDGTYHSLYKDTMVYLLTLYREILLVRQRADEVYENKTEWRRLMIFKNTLEIAFVSTIHIADMLHNVSDSPQWRARRQELGL